MGEEEENAPLTTKFLQYFFFLIYLFYYCFSPGPTEQSGWGETRDTADISHQHPSERCALQGGWRKTDAFQKGED